MRSYVVVLALVALLALPAASAIQEVAVDAPDLHLVIEGERFDVDTTDVTPGQKGVELVVETKDQELDFEGPSCRVRPEVSGAEQAARACEAEAPQAPRADVASFFAYALELHLADAAIAAPEGTDGAQAQSLSAGGVTPTQTVMLAAAAAGASLAALYGVWRVLKWTGLAAFLPLYSHLTDDEILEDANRQAIYRLIQAEPGISTKDIADRLHLAWGTVTHHLGKLEKRRFVVSKKYGKYRRYFANGHGGTDLKDQVAVLRLDRTGDVAALIQQNPGLTQKAVSAALGVSSSTILWHVKRLESAHLITKVREGKQVRYYPGEGLRQVLVPAVPVTAA